jgi:hypothetical protein
VAVVNTNPHPQDPEASDDAPESLHGLEADWVDPLDDPDDPTGPLEDAIVEWDALPSHLREAEARRPWAPPNVPPPPRVPRQPRKDRQVGVKLSAEDYDALVDAADIYGITPTTLARMLVRRGVLAVLRGDR